MNWKSIVALVVLLPAVTLAQESGNGNLGQGFRERVTRLAEFSPFSHLASESFTKAAAPLPFICPYFLYYQNDVSATSYYYSETAPNTSEWAMFVPAPDPQTQASVCTLWTVKLDFELLNAPLTAKDTIRIFVRKGTYPYMLYHTTFFLARPGHNVGSFIIYPPEPPTTARAIIDPMTSLFIGFRIIADSGHVVKYRFTTPSLYTGSGHSFKFTTPTSVVTASSALGVSADLVMEARLCCDKWIPVELSSFNAYASDGRVHLQWRTETETNCFQFEVQRAADPEGPWQSRGFIRGSGTTAQPREYSWEDAFTDEDRAAGVAPVYYYRLRQTDFDGTTYDYAPVQVQMSSLSALAYALEAVYPNPLRLGVSDNMRIRYRVPQPSAVRISVCDQLGRKIAVLADRIHQAGMHEAAWYPGDRMLRTGSYFVRLRADGKTLTRKIAVIR